MFALFVSLYRAMLTGSWSNINNDWSRYPGTAITTGAKNCLETLGKFFTSIFSGTTTPFEGLGDLFALDQNNIPVFIDLVAFVLALITSIGIVVFAVKGIKRVFGVFFMFVR